jgi:hypothetical protein
MKMKLLMELEVLGSEPIVDRDGNRETSKDTGAPLFRVFEQVNEVREIAGKSVNTTAVVGHKSEIELSEGKHVVECKQAIIAQSFGRPNVYYRILKKFGKEQNNTNKKAA